MRRYMAMDAICTECGQQCTCDATDFGIGKIEAWGVVLWDTDLCAVSDCCEAQCVSEGGYSRGDIITLQDLEDNYWDSRA